MSRLLSIIHPLTAAFRSTKKAGASPNREGRKLGSEGKARRAPRLRIGLLSSVAAASLAWACSGTDPTPPSSGGSSGTGNAGKGNAGNVGTGNVGNVGTGNTGNVGAGSGNIGNGGTSNAGTVGIAGTGNVGTANGGSGTIGNGGTNVGGAGGTPPAAQGGTGVGTGTGGSSGAGPAAGGSAGTPGGIPAGYWTSKEWKGCSWTGKGALGATTITPQDFVTKAAGAPYCISGVVGAEPLYKSVALLGFNVNEAAPSTCAYKPVDTTALGPPAVVPMADGIAVNFVKRGADTSFTLRVQIQGPNGAKDGPVGDADRWCATLTEVQGKVFVPYSSFTPQCWMEPPAMRGTPYARQPISAVVLSIPGKLVDTPYDLCVNGLAYGTTAADAPDGTAVGGDQRGTIGGTGPRDLDFARVKVNVDSENYIIQNNNWGQPDTTNVTLSYLNNSFRVTEANGTGDTAPASFPSIYIGNNGNTANGVFSTKTTDNMPVQISAITSLPTTFRYTGGPAGVYNACYDIWFANSVPTAEYQDGINGFVMVWLRDPLGKTPIGNQVATGVTVAGQPWNVWVGPRGAGPAGNNNAPVVSFVNPAEDNDSRAQSFRDVNLKEFLVRAGDYGIAQNLFLTDVFAGFEIWSGGVNLSVDEFKAVVNK